MTDDEVRARVAAVPHWYHPIEVRPGIVTPGANEAPAVLASCSTFRTIAAGCAGLDLGTRDGFFAFELERRGAEVMAVDYVAVTDSGFAVAAELLGSRVTYLQRNLYELDAAELGTFDIVLFLGLLYHLPDPLGALRVVRNLARQRMLLETLVLDFGAAMDELPLMRFFAGSSWAGDPTNYWGPNVRCVEEMLGETEFASRRVVRIGDRCIFDCEAIASPAAAYYMQIATGRRAPERAPALRPQMTPPSRLIVTGMHRSGTSFAASLLDAWNVRMGNQLRRRTKGIRPDTSRTSTSWSSIAASSWPALRPKRATATGDGRRASALTPGNCRRFATRPPHSLRRARGGAGAGRSARFAAPRFLGWRLGRRCALSSPLSPSRGKWRTRCSAPAPRSGSPIPDTRRASGRSTTAASSTFTGATATGRCSSAPIACCAIPKRSPPCVRRRFGIEADAAR